MARRSARFQSVRTSVSADSLWTPVGQAARIYIYDGCPSSKLHAFAESIICGNFDLLKSSKIPGDDRVAPASPRLGGQCFQVARGSHPRKPRSAAATVSSARQATSPAAEFMAKAVLGRIAKALGEMERVPHPG